MMPTKMGKQKNKKEIPLIKGISPLSSKRLKNMYMQNKNKKSTETE